MVTQWTDSQTAARDTLARRRTRARIGFHAAFAWSCLAIMAAAMAGCNGNDADSKSTPRFEVGDDTETPAPSSATPQVAGNQPASPAGNQPPAAPAGGAASPPAAAQPPADPGPTLEGYKTPEGSIDELLAFMENIYSRQPQGDSQQEQLADFVQMQQAIVKAADMVEDKQDASEDQLVAAAQHKVTALARLEEAGAKGVGPQVDRYLLALTASDRPRLAEVGRLVKLSRNSAALFKGEHENPAPIVAELKTVLQESEPSDTVFMITSRLAQWLTDSGFEEEGQEALDAVIAKFNDVENPEVQTSLAELRLPARLKELKLNEKLTAVAENQPDSVAAFMQVVQQLLEKERPTPQLFEVALQTSGMLEMMDHYGEALQIVQWAQESLASAANEQLRGVPVEALDAARKRLNLIGKKLPLEGAAALDGQPFDWESYRGKYVLVDFWASWCGPCIAEFPGMKQQYQAYREKGFEILGVNLDNPTSDGETFLKQQPLPWRTVKSVIPGENGIDISEYAGVVSIPFIVMVDHEGIVRDLHVRGPKLSAKLSELLGPPANAPDDAAPANPAGGAAAPPPTDSSYRPAARWAASPFASLADDAPLPAADNEAVETINRERAAAEREPERKFGEVSGVEIDPSLNPYAPSPELSKLELAQFILDMRDKPKTIQRREGFADGVIAACDRLIEATEGEGRYYEIAVLEKLARLHDKASFGDAVADAALQQFTVSLGEPEREKIAAEVKFLQTERRVIDAAEGEAAAVEPLLKELQEFYAGQALEEKHLRMASSTVKAINKIEAGEVREKHFQEFGKLFASSKNKELARYGKQIGKSGDAPSDLVGKPIEVAGLTASGIPVNWAAYRGKLVIVDFWATWCGPCRREMPNLKAAYELHKDAGLEVIGVSIDDDLEALAEYLDENKVEWPTIMGDEARSLAQKYGVRGIPTMMLVDQQGNVAAVAHNVESLAQKLKELLAGDQPE